MIADARELHQAGLPCELVTFGPVSTRCRRDSVERRLRGSVDHVLRRTRRAQGAVGELAGAKTIEVRSLRTLVRFNSGVGKGARRTTTSQFISLACAAAANQIGIPVMPPMTQCNEVTRGHTAALTHCFLFGGTGLLMGSGCYTCPARTASEAQFEAWRARQLDAAATDDDRREVEQTDLRLFTTRFMKPSTYVAARRMERSVRRLEGYV